MTADGVDAVVVGAGSVGAAAARALATDREVALIEKGRVAGEATGKASGVVSVEVEYPDQPAAVAHAKRFFESYDGHREFEYTPRPFVVLARPGQVADAREYWEFYDAFGHDVTFLDGDELEGRFPGVFPPGTFGAGVVFEDTGWVDPYTFATTLATDADERGAEIHTGVEVEDLLVEGGSVAGVDTTAGTVRAPNVVVAAGWWTRGLLEEHVRMPVRPERYQTANLEPGRPLGGEYPMASASDPPMYWRPEHNGQLHVGGGRRVLEAPAPPREGADEAFLAEVAEHVPERLAGLEDARIASGDCCPTGDAVTPDRYPILDAPAGTPDGLVIATGFSGYGIMAAPVAGAAVRGLVTGEDPGFPLGAFALSRFESRSPDFPPSEYDPFDVEGYAPPAD